MTPFPALKRRAMLKSRSAAGRSLCSKAAPRQGDRPPASKLYSEASGAHLGFKLAQVGLVLQETALRFQDHFLIELRGLQYDQRRRPVERLGDAGSLGQVQFSDRLDHARDLG